MIEATPIMIYNMKEHLKVNTLCHQIITIICSLDRRLLNNISIQNLKQTYNYGSGCWSECQEDIIECLPLL